jgi:hypothetical protein
MPWFRRYHLVEFLLLVTPVVGAGAILICALFLARLLGEMVFEAVGFVVIPFLTLYSLLLVLFILAMDFSEDPEAKDDLNHLLSIKRTTGFPIRPRRGGVRRFARPSDDLIDGLFHR